MRERGKERPRIAATKLSGVGVTRRLLLASHKGASTESSEPTATQPQTTPPTVCPKAEHSIFMSRVQAPPRERGPTVALHAERRWARPGREEEGESARERAREREERGLGFVI